MSELFEKVTIIEGKPETLPKEGEMVHVITNDDRKLSGWYVENKWYVIFSYGLNQPNNHNYPVAWLKPVEPVKVSPMSFDEFMGSKFPEAWNLDEWGKMYQSYLDKFA